MPFTLLSTPHKLIPNENSITEVTIAENITNLHESELKEIFFVSNNSFFAFPPKWDQLGLFLTVNHHYGDIRLRRKKTLKICW